MFFLFAFPLFYFVYKFGDPEPLAHDYFQYYHLFLRLNPAEVIAPHNMRLAGAVCVHLVYKLNIFFNTICTVDKYQSWGFIKQVYFCAVFCNWIFVSLTATMIYKILYRDLLDRIYAFIGGLLYLLGFGTIFYCMMPLTEAFSILVFVVFLWFYYKGSYLHLLPLAVLIFQREYLLVVIATMSVVNYFFDRERFQLNTFIAASLAFLVHYFLRKTIFYTIHLDYQFTVSYMLHNLLHLNLDIGEYLRHLFLGLNLFVLYLAILLVVKKKKLRFNKQTFTVLIIIFLQVNIGSLSGVYGNNAGRYFYLAIPLVIFAAVKEIKNIIDVEKLAP